MKTNKIEFIAVHDYAWDMAEKPFPAVNNIPKWWRDMPPYIDDEDSPGGKKLVLRSLKNNLSPKKCMPMMDAMTTGYVIPLWADVLVKNVSQDGEDYKPYISWKTNREVFEAGIDGSNHMQIPEGYSPNIFKFINLWCMRTPPGYSVRISTPIGYDLPFKAVDAVVDTDKYDAALPIPVFLKEGFEGLVERGTPMIQVQPFKRENWKSEFSHYPDGVHTNKQENWLRMTSFGNYIKTQWSKKSYK